MLALLKKLFLGITLRERLLLTGFIWVGVVLWLLANLASWRETYANLKGTSSSLASNQGIIDQEPVIDQKLSVEKSSVDPSKTYTASRLVEELELIKNLVATTSELKRFDLKSGRIKTEAKSIFNVNSIRVTINDARLSDLIYFDRLLQERSPYVTLSKVSLSNNRTDYRLCSADYEISSFELLSSPQVVPVTPTKGK